MVENVAHKSSNVYHDVTDLKVCAFTKNTEL